MRDLAKLLEVFFDSAYHTWIFERGDLLAYYSLYLPVQHEVAFSSQMALDARDARTIVPPANTQLFHQVSY